MLNARQMHLPLRLGRIPYHNTNSGVSTSSNTPKPFRGVTEPFLNRNRKNKLWGLLFLRFCLQILVSEIFVWNSVWNIFCTYNSKASKQNKTKLENILEMWLIINYKMYYKIKWNLKLKKNSKSRLFNEF